MTEPRFQLRPLEPADRDRVLAWRNSDRVRLHMFRMKPIEPEEHRQWFSAALSAAPDAFQILEVDGEAAGFASFREDLQHPGHWIWGIYVGDERAPRGSGTALGELALAHAFEVLGAAAVRSEAMMANERALQLYDRLGFRRIGTRSLKRDLHAGAEEVVILEIAADDWRTRRQVP